MDKAEYRELIRSIKNNYLKKDYEGVIEVSNQLELEKIRENSILEIIAKAYEMLGRYDLARETLLIAYKRTPAGKRIAYNLAMLSIKLDDLDSAVMFYEDFCKMAPKDNQRLLLKYEIGKAGGVPVKSLAAVLEKYNSREMDDKWEYELARLYHEMGDDDRCAAACDQIILWYANGEYEKKALELKNMHKALNPTQQARYEEIMHDVLGPAGGVSEEDDIDKALEIQPMDPAELKEGEKSDQVPVSDAASQVVTPEFTPTPEEIPAEEGEETVSKEEAAQKASELAETVTSPSLTKKTLDASLAGPRSTPVKQQIVSITDDSASPVSSVYGGVKLENRPPLFEDEEPAQEVQAEAGAEEPEVSAQPQEVQEPETAPEPEVSEEPEVSAQPQEPSEPDSEPEPAAAAEEQEPEEELPEIEYNTEHLAPEAKEEEEEEEKDKGEDEEVISGQMSLFSMFEAFKNQTIEDREQMNKIGEDRAAQILAEVNSSHDSSILDQFNDDDFGNDTVDEIIEPEVPLLSREDRIEPADDGGEDLGEREAEFPFERGEESVPQAREQSVDATQYIPKEQIEAELALSGYADEDEEEAPMTEAGEETAELPEMEELPEEEPEEELEEEFEEEFEEEPEEEFEEEFEEEPEEEPEEEFEEDFEEEFEEDFEDDFEEEPEEEFEEEKVKKERESFLESILSSSSTRAMEDAVLNMNNALSSAKAPAEEDFEEEPEDLPEEEELEAAQEEPAPKTDFFRGLFRRNRRAKEEPEVSFEDGFEEEFEEDMEEIEEEAEEYEEILEEQEEEMTEAAQAEAESSAVLEHFAENFEEPEEPEDTPEPEEAEEARAPKRKGFFKSLFRKDRTPRVETPEPEEEELQEDVSEEEAQIVIPDAFAPVENIMPPEKDTAEEPMPSAEELIPSVEDFITDTAADDTVRESRPEEVLDDEKLSSILKASVTAAPARVPLPKQTEAVAEDIIGEALGSIPDMPAQKPHKRGFADIFKRGAEKAEKAGELDLDALLNASISAGEPQVNEPQAKEPQFDLDSLLNDVIRDQNQSLDDVLNAAIKTDKPVKEPQRQMSFEDLFGERMSSNVPTSKVEPVKTPAKKLVFGKQYKLSKEQRRDLGEFLLIDGMEEEICTTIDRLVARKKAGDDTGGHLIVCGDAKTGKTFLTIEILKAVNQEVGRGNPRVAKVQASAINGKNIRKVLSKVTDSDLIIENIGRLEDDTIRDLITAVRENDAPTMVILEGNELAADTMIQNFPSIPKIFKTRINIGELTLTQWADVAMKYANGQGYKIDGVALLALHARIDAINTPDIRLGFSQVRSIVDQAIEKAEKRGSGKLFSAFSKKGEDELLQLTEDDFI